MEQVNELRTILDFKKLSKEIIQQEIRGSRLGLDELEKLKNEMIR